MLCKANDPETKTSKKSGRSSWTIGEGILYAQYVHILYTRKSKTYNYPSSCGLKCCSATWGQLFIMWVNGQPKRVVYHHLVMKMSEGMSPLDSKEKPKLDFEHGEMFGVVAPVSLSGGIWGDEREEQRAACSWPGTSWHLDHRLLSLLLYWKIKRQIQYVLMFDLILVMWLTPNQETVGEWQHLSRDGKLHIISNYFWSKMKIILM